MKTQNAITIIASALLVGGCAHHERETASYDTMASPGYQSMGSYRNGSTTYDSSTQTPIAGSEATTPSSSGKNPSDARTITSGTAKSDQPVGEADQALIVVVQKAITDEPAVSAVMPNLNVTAQNGAVTLTGTVANEQQKQQIENLVKNATGVTSVDNQLQVAYKPTSAGESSRIYSNATSHAEGQVTPSTSQTEGQGTSASQAGAATSPEGTATGTGTTPEQSKSQDSLDSSKTTTSPQTESDQKQSAVTQTDTSSAQALTPTGNTGDSINATVQGTTAADQSVAQKVIEQLRADSTLSAVMPLVQITVADGKATIKGAVKSEDQKQQIEKAVQQVSGVNSVDDQLKVSATSNDSTNP